ncbi:hypothetical protein BD413DRAFT_36474 [Trametes elegans]|nr:hypothetical protein BD413DRAFT_36474 [Trametes elegans]
MPSKESRTWSSKSGRRSKSISPSIRPLSSPSSILSWCAIVSSRVLTFPFCIFASDMNCFQVELLRHEYDSQDPAQGAPQTSPTRHYHHDRKCSPE